MRRQPIRGRSGLKGLCVIDHSCCNLSGLSVLSGVSRRARAFTGYIDAAGSSGAGESSYVWDMCYLRRMKYCDSRDRKEGTLLSLRNGSHCSCKQCWKRSRPSLAERASGVAPSPS
ncbi:hypothetical protein QQF64_010908 [Cirrhinus molitorella]|uniref:Uncharacterized protein n=1 Tax=Cirrhinus molitorella TaxID=172907 RepID=A0ABR3M0T8_9TELE